jgi:hypothetical protein
MLDDPIPVIIGGTTLLCPPMPFYCLERAWPHIQRLGRMGQLNQTLLSAQARLQTALGAEEQAAAEANVAAAQALIDREQADFVGQTREAIHIIAAALALDTPAPSYETLSRQVRPNEIVGIHRACAELMDGSGLQRALPGEALATSQVMPPLNGAGSSLN